ncbi:MAG: ATP-binding protein [Wenzhouxiangella sp.]
MRPIFRLRGWHRVSFMLLLAVAWPVPAEVEVAPGWSALRWGVEDGLPVNSINAMVQDDRGFLWLATMDGLARFDGLTFKVFDSDSHPDLASNRLVMLKRDGEALWLVSEDNRLIRYADGSFATVTQEMGLPDDQVFAFEHAAGHWWAGTMRGAAWWDGERFRALDADLWAEHTLAIGGDSEGGVWLGASSGRLARWLDSRFDVDLDLGEPFWTLTPDSSEGMWIGRSRGRGVALWKNGALQPALAALEEIEDVLRIEFAPDGSQYLHGGVTLYRFADGQLEVLTENLNRSGKESLVLTLPAAGEFLVNHGYQLRQGGTTLFSGPARINAMLVDHENNIWVATASDGLYRLRTSPLVHYQRHPELGTTPAYPIVADFEHKIWIGTGGAGFYIIDAEGQVLDLPHSDRPIDMIYSLLPPETPAEAAWIGGLGLHRWQDGVYSQEGLPPLLSRAMVQALYRDGEGTVWAGTFADGLWRLRDDTWRRVELPAVLSTATVRVMLEDRSRTLWMGTNGHGLLRRYDGGYEAVGPPQGMNSLLVRALHLDETGRLWIGTETHGLCRIDNPADVRAALDIRCIGRGQGLFHHGVHQILPDDTGHFWMSTNRGIFRVAVTDLDAVLDGHRDMLSPGATLEAEGLPNREANGGVQSAGTIGPDGNLWFPTMAGPVVIDPHRVDEGRITPKAHIEDLLVKTERLGPLPSPIELPVGERDLSIRYTAPGFVNPANMQFEFRLVGYDPDWRSAGTRRQIDYINLPHGQYRFEVRALEMSGLPGPAAAQDLMLPPRLYETALFRGALVALVTGLLMLIWRRREFRTRAERSHLEALVATRTAELDRRKSEAEQARDELARQAEQLRELDREKRLFFANISHELRTPLTLLLGPLEQAESNLKTLAGNAPMMQRNVRQLNRLVEQILDLQEIEGGRLEVKPEFEDLCAWVESLSALFQPLAQRRQIRLHLHLPPEGVLAWFDRLQMEKVLGNLLSNACKYCRPGDQVEVRVERDEESANIEVIDTGPGIAAEHLPNLFDRFYRAELPDSPIVGTGIGLAVAHELVVLHGGELKVASEVGRGTRFSIRWPARARAGRLAPEHTEVDSSRGAEMPLPVSETAQPSTEPEARILLVDDNRDLRAWLQHSLSDSFLIDEADDGAQALEIMHANLPDLVVTDWMMPELDGVELIRRMRAHEVLASVPVILLTARAEIGDRLDGLGAGAVAFVNKPFNVEVLRAQIASVLDLQLRLRRELAARAAPASRPEAPESPWITQVRDKISQQLHDPDFGVKQLADALAIDRSGLFRRLKEEIGENPSKLIREARLECARELLERRAGTVSEIAYAVGFNSFDGFARAYRRHFGEVPSAARAAAGSHGQADP